MAEWWHVGKTLQILKDRIAKRQNDENLPFPPIPKRRNERWNDGKLPEIQKDGRKSIKPPVLGTRGVGKREKGMVKIIMFF